MCIYFQIKYYSQSKNKQTIGLTETNKWFILIGMKKYKSLSEAINSIGKNEVASLMSQETGQEFSWQTVNNWLHRGVPYRWHDQFQEITGLDKSLLRQPDQAA